MYYICATFALHNLRSYACTYIYCILTDDLLHIHQLHTAYQPINYSSYPLFMPSILTMIINCISTIYSFNNHQSYVAYPSFKHRIISHQYILHNHHLHTYCMHCIVTSHTKLIQHYVYSYTHMHACAIVRI